MVQHYKAIEMAETEKLTTKRDQYGRWLKGVDNGLEKLYKNPQAMLEVAEEYLDRMAQEKRPATMAGLSRALGFKSRQALLNYRSAPGYEQFHDVVAYLKLRMEEHLEERLISPECKNVVGLIFAMKNNYNYADKQEVTMESRNMNLTGFTLVNPNDNGRQD